MCIYKIFTLNRDNLWNSTGWVLLNLISFAGQAHVLVCNFHRLWKPFSCSILFSAQKHLQSAWLWHAHPKRCCAPTLPRWSMSLQETHQLPDWEPTAPKVGPAPGSRCRTKPHPNYLKMHFLMVFSWDPGRALRGTAHLLKVTPALKKKRVKEGKKYHNRANITLLETASSAPAVLLWATQCQQ